MYFRVQELIDSLNSTETWQDETVEEASEPDPVVTEEPSDASKPKKKKKKKDIERDDQAVEDLNNNQTSETMTHDVNCNGMDSDPDPNRRPTEKKKKKKKKKEEKLDSDAELPSPGADLPGSDSSGYINEKSRKKRKAQEDLRLQEDSDILPTKKKKKK